MRSRVLLALSCGGLLFCHALSATTLKFGSDVELLAIDGQPLPAALFKSANSLGWTPVSTRCCFGSPSR
ncbi:hypothetical protein O0544_22940 [Edwardsiella anguillarum]|nr:hypothetical protein [Edwardsiella anguillarum]